jgi:DNA-binding LacI/PurR family transcriptional regulator
MPRATKQTLLDVARVAGVSRTTASAALSRTGRISEETRAHVLAVADQLGYAPNIWARKLRQDPVIGIGLYIPAYVYSRSYYMDFAFGAAEGAHSRDVSLVLLASALDPTDGAFQLLDGLIVVDPLDDDPIGRRLLGNGIPVVTGEFGPADLPRAHGVVATDHPAAIRRLLDHLSSEGARRTALIAPSSTSHWGRAVRAGYLEWCGEHRMEPLVSEVPFDSTPADVEEATGRLLDAGTGMDAVISAPDGAAVGALSAARARGLTVGEDLLVASYVDSPVMQTASPPITAVDLRPRALGYECARLLLDILDAPEPRESCVVELPTELVARASTHRPR